MIKKIALSIWILLIITFMLGITNFFITNNVASLVLNIIVILLSALIFVLTIVFLVKTVKQHKEDANYKLYVASSIIGFVHFAITITFYATLFSLSWISTQNIGPDYDGLVFLAFLFLQFYWLLYLIILTLYVTMFVLFLLSWIKLKIAKTKEQNSLPIDKNR